MFSIPTDQLIGAFQSCTLPKADWTHQAHLRVGVWHVRRFGADEALVRLRDGIRRLNESHGTANTDTSGYHETITRLYVLVTHGFFAAADRSRSLDDLTADFIAHYPTSDLPLRYYSRERLFSVQARRDWVEPDLASIDATLFSPAVWCSSSFQARAAECLSAGIRRAKVLPYREHNPGRIRHAPSACTTHARCCPRVVGSC